MTSSSRFPAVVRETQSEPLGGLEQTLPPPTLRAKCFAVANRWFHRLFNFAGALHRGFWLGCLSAEDLNAITTERYAGSQFLLSTEYIQSGLFDWERPLVDRYFHSGTRVLVAAAGTGREILALRKAGFNAEGFECNPLLLRIGQATFDQIGEPFPVSFCAPDNVPPGPQIYDGLIVGWTGYTHIPTRIRRIRFLQALRSRALPHSPLVLSFFTKITTSRYDNIACRTAAISRALSRTRAEGPIEPGDDLEGNQYLHRFTRPELEAELTAAGFRMAYYSEDAGSGVAAAFAE
jgi:hypothetical protein